MNSTTNKIRSRNHNSQTKMHQTPIPFEAEEVNGGGGERRKEVNTKREKRWALSTFEELPDYMKDNDFIRKYYRVEWPIRDAALSLFRWHNETLNIWTHLVGFGLFLGLTLVNLVHVPQFLQLLRSFPYGAADTITWLNTKILMGMAKLLDMNNIIHLGYDHISMTEQMLATRWPFYVFLSGAMFCLFSSSICHLFCCHSYHLSMQLLRVDYFGINIMIITSFFPPIYYIFQCNPVWQLVYLSVISLMGLFTGITLFSPTLSSGDYRGFRTTLFVLMGIFGVVPAIHAVVLLWDNPRRNVTIACELLMGFFYLVGAAFYVSRIPERFKPGRFDIAGQSHQIFHVLVVMGALAHYCAALVFLEFRDAVGCS
ncbi:hypothetical protein Droror1_Dr00011639 [Drosera rotundifolia]